MSAGHSETRRPPPPESHNINSNPTTNGITNGTSTTTEDSELAGNPDDPPPAYEATPNSSSEQTLEYGPLRPFQQPLPPPRHPATSSQSYNPPNQAPPPSLPAPAFPFWNGSSLTPQQTGFVPGPNHPFQLQNQGFQPPSHPPPTPQFAPPSHPPPPRTQEANSGQKYQPTTIPTPGQPLLRGNKILVYPEGHFCGKCGNTGYKQNDPSHPCRKDWDKYSKPYTSAYRLAPSSVPAKNWQRPLRAFNAPASSSGGGIYGGGGYGGGGYGGGGYNHGSSQGIGIGQPPTQVFMGHPPPNMHQPNGGGPVLVLRPGDPRMGGQLCRTCNGRGSVEQLFSFFGDEETCWNCRGAGRVFP
ncbi:hypothetical protein T439DRAFT_328121 [Meredithblackwellia eburnea MCA 4105]